MQQASALTAIAAMGSANAQAGSDYKALVCIFLHGGNDAYNTVLATDGPSWSNYLAVRTQSPESIALRRDWLNDLSPRTAHAGRSFALHPKLSGLASLFNQDRRLAVIPNVGPLLEPTTKQQYDRQQAALPAKLFSHNDQQSTWLAFAPEGATTGWGGRIADAMASSNGQSLFSAVSGISSTVWLVGKQVRPYQVSAQGGLRVGTLPDAKGVSRVYGSDKVGAALEQIVQWPRSNHAMEADLCDVNRRAMQAQAQLANKLPPADSYPFALIDPTNPLAQQLQIVARMISAHGALGLKRQVFYVSLYGFDTHDRQNQRHTSLMTQLDQAMTYFDKAMAGLGMLNQVTTFTASDFGRTFTSNGDGTDHGWGGHHFVMGGAVNGGEILGAFPVLAAKSHNDNEFPGSPDQLSNGILLPAVSTQSYGAAMAKWFGLDAGQLADVFPLLGRMEPTPELDRLFKA